MAEPGRVRATRNGLQSLKSPLALLSGVPTLIRMERGDPGFSAGAYATALWLIGRVGENEDSAPSDNRVSRCGSEQMPPPGKRTLPPYPMEIAPMNLIVWLVVGGLIGWIASMLMGTSGQQGIILNIVVGIVGAFLGGWLLGGLFGTTTINEGNFSLGGVIVSLLGASILIGAVRLIRSP